MSPRGAASESSPRGESVRRQDVCVSDDSTPRPEGDRPAPNPDAFPPKKKLRPRGSRAAPPSAMVAPGLSPRVTLFATSVAMVVLLFAVARYMGAFEGKVDRVFEASAKPKVGTSPAAVAALEKELAEKRAFAEGVFGPDIWTPKDDTEFAEEPEWASVLVTMSKLDPQFVVDHLDFSLNNEYDEVMKDPAQFRGRFVRMRGLVASNFRAYKLRKPVDGRGDVYRGLMADTDGEHWVFFDLLDRPPQFRTMTEKPPGADIVFSNAEAVDVDGVLYRTVRYEKRGDPNDLKHDPPRWVTVPWIIARTVVRCQPDEVRPSTTPYIIGGIAAFLALVGSIVYLVRRGRRQSASPGTYQAGFRAMFAERLHEERRRKPPRDGEA
jgi:hypothetical protein